MGEKGTKALTNKLFEAVALGGKLIIGNASLPLPDFDHFMMHLLDWNLIYRNDEEILAFADAIDKKDIANIKVEKEVLGWNSFLVIEKANTAGMPDSML